jgi:flagellar hook-associated protein 1 FlgK
VELRGNNIANAQTPGYTRQRLNLQPMGRGVAWDGYGAIGGVRIAGVERLRDPYLDEVYRREAATQQQFQAVGDWLTRLEGALGPLTSSPLIRSMDEFFSAWTDLANAPNSAVARAGIQTAAQEVVTQINALGGRLAQTREDVLNRLNERMNILQDATEAMGGLNMQIVSARGAAPELEDQRDRLLDEVAQLTGARVTRNPRGDFTVVAGSSVLLDGVTSSPLSLRQDAAGKVFIAKDAAGSPFTPFGGELAGLLQLVNEELPAISASLDSVVYALVQDVNRLHEAGTTPGGFTGIAFFDPSGTTANSLRVNGQILADATMIASSFTSAISGNDLALAVADLRTSPTDLLAGLSITEGVAGLFTTIGSRAARATNLAEGAETLLTSITEQREAANGVNQDEELIGLIQSQSAYQAAARILGVADELMQTLLAIGR